jgi:hypothetical protein
LKNPNPPLTGGKGKKGRRLDAGLHSPELPGRRPRLWGAAARPLDGGALTRKGNTRTGEGNGDDAIFLHLTVRSGGHRRPLTFLGRSRQWKEKGDEGRVRLGFPNRGRARFCSGEIHAGPFDRIQRPGGHRFAAVVVRAVGRVFPRRGPAASRASSAA